MNAAQPPEYTNTTPVHSTLKEHSWRYQFTAVIFFLMAMIIILRIVLIQFDPSAQKIGEFGEYFNWELHVFYPARGQIFDRWGNLLAGNQQVYDVVVDLTQVRNPETIAFAMSKVLLNHPGYDRASYYDEVFTIASQESISGSTSFVLANFVTEEEIRQLKDWAVRYDSMPVSKDDTVKQPSLSGLIYRPRLSRIYPEKELASNVLGFVGGNGAGIYGVEEKFNDLLAGEAMTYWVNTIPYKADKLPEVDDGVDLILTLDREVQRTVENILDQALIDSGAVAGTILVMNPENGEILAMATTPRIDLNQYYEYADFLKGRDPFNRAIGKDYEPGSVFKVLTMAAALDSLTVTPDYIFVDTGSFTYGGITVYNWNWGAWGPQDMTGCLQHSLNVCLAAIAEKMGPETFYSYMQNFGIGHLTGIDLAGEVPGRLKVPGDGDWWDSELVTNSFGQGVAVTTVQMLMAVSSLANDGQMVSPHLLRSMVDNGNQFTPTRTMVGMPISKETAHTLTSMLATSLEGESSDALVPGYRVAGKTGTAEIPTLGGYESGQTNASFVGWGPVDDPKLLVYVWLEEPSSSMWGSVVAAPVFSQVFSEVALLTNLPPDDVRASLSGE
ncbi:MAG: penicillin-binding protein 2 [Anaerolineales bacterium]|jgi:cell division protein FtsI/penicillin-binding protein 2|nr:penicillin-binding protein 2 [Anaerolineales bacterium]